MQWNYEWDQAHLLLQNEEKMKLIFIHLLQPPIRKIYKLKNITLTDDQEDKWSVLSPIMWPCSNSWLKISKVIAWLEHKPIQEGSESWDGRVDWKIKTWFASSKGANTNLVFDMGHLVKKSARSTLTSQELDSLWLIYLTKSPWPKIRCGIETTLQESFHGSSTWIFEHRFQLERCDKERSRSSLLTRILSSCGCSSLDCSLHSTKDKWSSSLIW